MQKFTSLLVFTWCALANMLSDEERRALLECHTKLREGVQPTASNMHLMTYSLDVEKVAEKFVETCPNSQDVPQSDGFGYIGPIEYFVKPHFGESLCQIKTSSYDYVNNTCHRGCQYYKQMVWASSTQVGCAAKQCSHKAGVVQSRYVLACFYKPGQILLKTRPYESGAPCSKCSDGFECHRNQCRKSVPITTSTPSALTSTTNTSAISSPSTTTAAVQTAEPRQIICSISQHKHVICKTSRHNHTTCVTSHHILNNCSNYAHRPFTELISNASHKIGRFQELILHFALFTILLL
uniref:SCP domain-containing protein n=1 Tax=Mesocestoides corti TaxID=53468 RepID=A0A5K3FVV9_MESCO